jgi:hypothetical protein
MVGFFDDATGSCNDFRPQTQLPIDELTQKMEHAAQIWQDLLHASGGALELTKSSFQTLHFTFLPNGQPQAVIDATDHAIQLRDSTTGRLIPITVLPTDHAHKTMGHYKAPAAPKQKRQLTEILTKAKRNGVLIGTSPISRYGATLAYFSIFLSAVKYPLPQFFFDKKTLDRTESKVMGSIIARCGYNRHTAYAILYAPTSLAGGGFVHWYTLQGEGQIQQFLKHWRTNTMISQMLRIYLAWSQWQSGLSQLILNATATPLPHLECRWLCSLRTFLQYSTSQLHVHQPCIQPIERLGDFHIMDYAIQSGCFDEEALRIINYCQLHLHVTTISELFNADGTYMLPEMFACRRAPWMDPTTIVTLQKKPGDYQIRYRWKQLCRE